MQDNQFQLRLTTASQGCTDPASKESTWYTPNAMIPHGVNEVRVHFQDSTDIPDSDCPLCMVPVTDKTECDGLLYTDFISLSQAELTNGWCDLSLSSTCIQALLNPDTSGETTICPRWDYGTWNEAGTGCTGDSARITWVQDGGTPTNFSIVANVRPSGCAGDCTTLVFSSGTISIDAGGLTAGKLNQAGIDEIEALLAAGVTLTREDVTGCVASITELVAKITLDCDPTSNDIVNCCKVIEEASAGTAGGASLSSVSKLHTTSGTRCECVTGGGTVVTDVSECQSQVYCCVDGVVVIYTVPTGGSISTVCGGANNVFFAGEDAYPAGVSAGDPCVLCCGRKSGTAASGFRDTTITAHYPTCGPSDPYESDALTPATGVANQTCSVDPCEFCNGFYPAETFSLSYSGTLGYGPSCTYVGESVSGSATLTYAGDTAAHAGTSGAYWTGSDSGSGTIDGQPFTSRVFRVILPCDAYPCGGITPGVGKAVLQVLHYDGATYRGGFILVSTDFNCFTGGTFGAAPTGCCWGESTGSGLVA